MEAAAALTDMYDQALLGILQHVGNVEEFLRVLFGFLYRKTDFYRLLLRPGDRLGFPPGAAQAMALQAFKVFERMARQDDEKRRRELEAKLRKKEEEEEAAAAAERVKLAPAAQEVEVETTAEHIPAPDAGGAAGTQESATAQDAAPSPVSAEPPGAAAPAEPRPAEVPTRQEQFQTNPDSYNGAVRENYAWSQDYSDLEIKVPVPKHIVKGKQVSVDISSGTIRVAVLEGSSQRVLMEGKLTHKINTESSLWSLEPGKCVLTCGLHNSPAAAETQRASFRSGALCRCPPCVAGALSTPPAARDCVPGSCPCPRRRAEAPVPGIIPVLCLLCHTRSLVKSEIKIALHELFLEISAGCCAQHVLGLFSLLRIFPPRSLSFSPPLQHLLSTLGLLSPSPALNSYYSLRLVIS